MPHAHPRRWLILFVILAAECMDLLDGTVVNVAAPTIHSELGTSSTALQWILGGYPLAIAVGLITGGRLGDLFGRRRLFVIGAAGFTAASVLCGLAPSTGFLIGARLVQGALGALMLPQGFSIIRDVFPPEEIPKVFGVFGPVMGGAALLGPIVGGGLIGLDVFGTSWRMVFLINLPLGIAAVIGGLRVMPESRAEDAAGLDIGGVGLVTGASILLVYPLIQGRELGWPVWTYVSMAASL
ncbi:MAG TPA: MFS transporter, partial [Solirubrobacteraceae bacterium]|nr:MFS transporter [Solirubrobacteraceae bacterium]